MQRSSEMNAVLSEERTSIHSLPILTTGHDLEGGGRRTGGTVRVRTEARETRAVHAWSRPFA